MMEIFYRSPWVTIERDPSNRIIIYRRTTLPFASTHEMASAFDAVRMAVADMPLHDWSLLIDTREGPMRNDDAFEAALRPFRQQFTQRFARTATLVKTAVGKLQVARYAREEHREPRTFLDEAEAIAYLVGDALEAKVTSRPR